MKKEEISGLIVYVLLLALALIFALLVVREYYTKSGMEVGEYILFIFLSFFIGIVFNAALFELAHAIGAKLGRYNIISLNILGFTFYREAGKLKFKFSSFDGLTGETKILPKEGTKKKPNPRPYLLFGTLLYAIEIISVIFVYSFLTGGDNSQLLKNFGFGLLVIGVVGGGMLLYNIIPFHLDSMTDGYRLILLSNKKNRDAFNDLLVIQNSADDEKVKKTIEQSSDLETTIAFSADIKVNQIYNFLEKEDFVEAEKVLDEIITNPDKKTSQKTYLEAKSQKIYIVIMTKPLEEALEYYEKEVSLSERRAISEEKNFVSTRAYILMSALLDKSRSECFLALKGVYKAYKKLPVVRQKVEIHLYNLAINKIDEAHPNWGVKEYLMNE